MILGMPRWRFKDDQGEQVLLPTEFNHYEGALARTLGLPTLVLAHQDVMRRVVFDFNFGGYIGEVLPMTRIWAGCTATSSEFRSATGKRCSTNGAMSSSVIASSSSRTAEVIKRCITSLGARVLDWQTDFIPGRTIIDQIEQAAARSHRRASSCSRRTMTWICRAEAPRTRSAPRDNVVFEAGYFSGLKGKRNVLIVREAGSKMPADLGGDIYASLADKDDISANREGDGILPGSTLTS